MWRSPPGGTISDPRLDPTQDPAFFHRIVEATGEGVWTIDAEDRTTYVNRGMAAMLGWTPLEMLGRSMYAFLHEDGAAVRPVGREGPAERREFPLRHRHGYLVWGELSATPLYDARGEYVGSLAFVRDVTEQRRLREERERLVEDLATVADVVDRAPVSIHVYDERGYASRVNDAARRLEGGPEARGEARRFNCLTDPEAIRSGLAARMARAYSGEVVTAQVLIEPAPGASGRSPARWVEQIAYPIRRPDGRVVGAVSLTQDVTARRRAETALAEAQRLESLGLLAGGVAHDFNNLFAALLGHVDIALEDPRTTPASRAALERIASIAHRAADRTRQLLAFAGGGPSRTERLDLNTLVRETLEMLRLTADPPPPLELAVDDGGLWVDADAGQVRQVLLNLVHNAHDAVPSTGGRIRVRTGVVDLEPSPEWRGRCAPGRFACVEVEDNGPGVDPEAHGRIFEPFFSTKATGRGLGLSTALGIVRNHSGGIRVESPPGRGATFTVALPLAEGAEATSRPPASLSPPTPMVSAEQVSVLVADDDAGVLEVMCRMLELSGYAVVLTHDGQEALDRFTESPDAFGAVVLDLLMPRMGGAEAYQRIRALRPRVPILLCSGFDPLHIKVPPPDDMHARFLGKPFGRRQLQGLLAELLPKPR